MSSVESAAESREIHDSGLLDSVYYLSSYPDVRASGLDALDHYCNFGWREGRKPSPYFDGAWYLQQNPDVLSADVNPLLHYVRHGDHEGRRPIPVFDTAWYRAAYQIAPDELALAHFLTRRQGARTLPSPELFFALYTNPGTEPAFPGNDPFATFASSTTTESAM
ncbi:MAG: glycosyl transferase family 1, partial [Acetobacteraceae bacterium]|nr:glycosyl transferase family 1 [Acetobacteraceae bacterium]